MRLCDAVGIWQACEEFGCGNQKGIDRWEDLCAEDIIKMNQTEQALTRASG